MVGRFFFYVPFYELLERHSEPGIYDFLNTVSTLSTVIELVLLTNVCTKAILYDKLSSVDDAR